MMVLITEEDRSKHSLGGIKKEFGLKTQTEKFEIHHGRQSEPERQEQARTKIQYLTDNLRECQRQVMDNDTGDNSKTR